MIDLEKESLCRKCEKIQKKVNIFCCAKQQEMVDEDRQEWEIRKEKAAIVREREEDLEPERYRIGGLLCDYYRKQIEDNKERQIKISNQKIQIKDDVAQQKERLENYREEIKKIIEQKGGLRSLVRNYDNTEIKYNTRYKENLSRNILGIYEPGMLEIKQETYEQEVKKSLQENKKRKKNYKIQMKRFIKKKGC